jgi:hypothetical protein
MTAPLTIETAARIVNLALMAVSAERRVCLPATGATLKARRGAAEEALERFTTYVYGLARDAEEPAHD